MASVYVLLLACALAAATDDNVLRERAGEDESAAEGCVEGGTAGEKEVEPQWRRKGYPDWPQEVE